MGRRAYSFCNIWVWDRRACSFCDIQVTGMRGTHFVKYGCWLQGVAVFVK